MKGSFGIPNFGLAACTFALAPIPSVSAMPIAPRIHLPMMATQSSKSMAGAITVAEVIITDGAEAIITVGDIITIGEI